MRRVESAARSWCPTRRPAAFCCPVPHARRGSPVWVAMCFVIARGCPGTRPQGADQADGAACSVRGVFRPALPWLCQLCGHYMAVLSLSSAVARRLTGAMSRQGRQGVQGAEPGGSAAQYGDRGTHHGACMNVMGAGSVEHAGIGHGWDRLTGFERGAVVSGRRRRDPQSQAGQTLAKPSQPSQLLKLPPDSAAAVLSAPRKTQPFSATAVPRRRPRGPLSSRGVHLTSLGAWVETKAAPERARTAPSRPRRPRTALPRSSAPATPCIRS